MRKRKPPFYWPFSSGYFKKRSPFTPPVFQFFSLPVVQPEDQYIRNLLIDYVHNNLDSQQTEELFGYLNAHPVQAERLLKEFAEIFDVNMTTARPPEEEVSQRMLQGLLTKIGSATVIPITTSNGGQWKRWVVAAAVFLLAGAFAYFIIDRQPKRIVNKISANPQHT